MKLPGGDKAVISKDKLVDYILSESHSTGRFKAKYFRSFGFVESNVNFFITELLNLVKSNAVTDYSISPFGTKYIIDGEINTPKKIIIKLRTVWIVERGDTQPRFVTAYPV